MRTDIAHLNTNPKLPGIYLGGSLLILLSLANWWLEMSWWFPLIMSVATGFVANGAIVLYLKQLEEHSPKKTSSFEKNPYRIIHKNGETRIQHSEALVERDENGNPIRMLGFTQDLTEQPKREETLRSSPANLNSILENTTDYILICDRDGQPLLYNSAYRQIMKEAFDVDMNEGVRLHEKILDQPTRESWNKLHQRVLSGEKFRIEMSHHFGPNDLRHFEFSYNPIVENGEVTGFCEVSRDITERRRAETQIRAGERQFRELSDNIREVFWVYDVKRDKFLYVSPAYEEIWGRKVEEVYKSPKLWLQDIHPDDREEALEGFHHISKNPDGELREYRIIRPDGTVRWISDRGYAVRENEEDIERVVGIAEDITERKQVEQALQDREERIRAMLNIIPDITFVFDEKGKYLEIHTQKDELLYDTYESLKGHYIEEKLPPEEARRCMDVIHRTMETGEHQLVEYTLETPGEGTLYFEGKTALLKAEGGEKNLVVWVARDVTQRVRSQLSKEKLEAQLRHTQKLENLGTLAGGIAHDLNNILQPIFGYAAVAMVKLSSDPKTKGYLENIIKAADRAKNLVEQILYFSRHMDQKKQYLDMEEVLEEALALLRSTLPSTIDIKTEISPVGQILADPTQLHQVLMNLGSNAYHAMRERGGTLTFTLNCASPPTALLPKNPPFHQAPMIHLAVTDTGHGMSAEVREKIFDPFFTTKVVGEGTGLGLSTVHGIVTSHGGYIEVESEINRETTFHIYLPRAVEGTGPLPVPVEEIYSATEPRKILLVDDEEIIVTSTCEMLEELGYEVTPFTDSQLALEELEKSPYRFDVVITDQTMPHLTGLELSEKIRNVRPELPIILTTGYSEVLLNQNSPPPSISKIMLKPVPFSRLSRAIHDVFRPSSQ